MAKNFMFVDLSSASGKDFDGMASGSFVDFRGTEVTIKSTDLAEIVRKTKLAIESTRGESGVVVGLPIDEDAHDHRGGAGWIVDVSLDRSGSKIRFTPKWTQIGIDLISKNIRRFFSVSVDLQNKVIMGGSLTNWPATRDAKSGNILLRPIELSQSIFALEKESGMTDLQMNRKKMESAIRKYAKENPDSEIETEGLAELSEEEVLAMYKKCSGKDEEESDMSSPGILDGLTKIATTIREFVSQMSGKGEADEEDEDESDDEDDEEETESEGETNMAKSNTNPVSNLAMSELLRTPEAILELGRMAELKAQEFLAVERRKIDVVEFASTLVGGTKDKPFGLPIPASEVVELLLSLEPAQAEAVKRILTKTLNAVNFAEKGLDGEFLFGRPRLPAEFRQSLQLWVDEGKTVESFFKANVELGKATDFNLSEFQVARVG